MIAWIFRHKFDIISSLAMVALITFISISVVGERVNSEQQMAEYQTQLDSGTDPPYPGEGTFLAGAKDSCGTEIEADRVSCLYYYIEGMDIELEKLRDHDNN